MKMRSANGLYVTLLIMCFLLDPADTSGQVKQPDSLSRAPHVLGVKAADPFDVETGIYSREYVDLLVEDSIPINFTRTQRNMDSRSRSFGIGASTSYDMFVIGDVKDFSWVALVFADGSQIRYARVSPGKGFADGVFESQANPGSFLGSRISWNKQGVWTVVLQDGTQFIVLGCSATSKPGQCAVSEIKNARGERLTVDRDKDGNIVRITSPHGHFVSVTNDSEGRITRAETDSHKWVEYRYDDKGCLAKARNWRGDTQRFAYDNRFNMTFVHEKGPRTKRTEAYDFSVRNFYDDQNRLKRQRVSTGEVYSAKYISDDEHHTRETDVRAPIGLSRYFFNEARYEIREEFRSADGTGWTLELSRDPNSNAAIDATLQCRAAKIHLPLKHGSPLELNGESQTIFLTRTCERMEREHKPQEEHASGSDQ